MKVFRNLSLKPISFVKFVKLGQGHLYNGVGLLVKMGHTDLSCVGNIICPI